MAVQAATAMHHAGGLLCSRCSYATFFVLPAYLAYNSASGTVGRAPFLGPPTGDHAAFTARLADLITREGAGFSYVCDHCMHDSQRLWVGGRLPNVETYQGRSRRAATVRGAEARLATRHGPRPPPSYHAPRGPPPQ
jgi:hypothetical protein